MTKSPKALLREYFRRKLAEKGGLPAGEEFEDFVAECSASWENEPCGDYGGLTPKRYFAEITDVGTLIDMFERDIKEGGEPSAVITERLEELPAAAAALTDIVTGDGGEEIRLAAADILWRADRVSAEAFADVIFDADTPEALRERLIDILSDAPGIYPALAERMDHVSGTNALILGELLVRSGEMNDGIYSFLLKLTGDAETLPRALQLIASYGDMRAIPELKKLALNCDYATYTDIRAAVEELCGDMDVERDWKGDPTYERIKGGK